MLLGSKSRALFVALLESLVADPNLRAQSGWTYLGPDGGHVPSLIQDAVVPSTLYASSQGGFSESDDGGDHWSKMGVVSSLLATGGWPLLQDAESPMCLYTTQAGVLWRSADRGATWTPQSAMPYGDPLTAIVDVPASSDHLYALSPRWGVLYSEDSGQHWVMHSNGLPPGFVPGALAISPTSPTIALLASSSDGYYTSAALYRSLDGGSSWQAVSLPNLDGGFGQPLIAFGAGARVYAAVGTSLYRSNDLGGAWSTTSTSTTNLITMMTDGTDPDVLWCGRSDGLFRSGDGGSSWTAMNSGLDANATSKAAVRALVRDASDATRQRLWAATDRSGIFRSDDGGAHWSGHNAGLWANSFRAVALHPGHPERIYAGTGEDLSTYGAGHVLYVSNDGGTTWNTSDLDVLARLIRDVAIDHTTAQDVATTHMYAVGFWATSDARNGGIYKSIDGGSHWFTADQGLPLAYYDGIPTPYVGKVRSITLDARSCSSPPPSGPCTSGPLRTLYVTTNGNLVQERARVARSDDGAATWTDISGDLPHSYDDESSGEVLKPSKLLVDSVSNNILYLGTYDFTYADPGISPPTPRLANGFFRSEDGGQHWLWRSNGLPMRNTTTAYDVGAMVVHPYRSGVLWVAVNDLNGGTASRIYKTVDGGETWDRNCNSPYPYTCGMSDCDVRTLAIDPAAPDVLYAGGFATDGRSGCLLRSEDGGAWWTPLAGDAWTTGMTSLVQDGTDHTRFVVGSNTGVWRLREPSEKIFIDGFGQ